MIEIERERDCANSLEWYYAFKSGRPKFEHYINALISI